MCLRHHHTRCFPTRDRPRFVNVDFSNVSARLRYLGLKMHFDFYDVNCQYRKKLAERLETYLDDFFPGIERTWPESVHYCIGKFHMHNHKRECQELHDPYVQRGLGVTDGEQPERNWREKNKIGPSLREMTPGGHEDILVKHQGNTN